MKKMTKRVGVIDYGVGNLFSVEKALRCFVDDVDIIACQQSLNNIDALVLPGVGAFHSGMIGLEKISMTEEVKNFADSGKPLLGICLGAQLLLSEGNEHGVHEGLGIISGKVERLKHFPGVKIPHIGWASIYPVARNGWENTVLDNINPGEYTYFVHSYFCSLEDESCVVAYTEYGSESYCSVFKKGNVTGVQFHPEKSGSAGLRIIENFLKLPT